MIFRERETEFGILRFVWDFGISNKPRGYFIQTSVKGGAGFIRVWGFIRENIHFWDFVGIFDSDFVGDFWIWYVILG